LASSVFFELSLILALAVMLSAIMQFLRQPLIIGYIITGILAGPFILDVVKSVEALSVFSHIGISLLLFMVGISLNPEIIKDVGKVSLITGVSQVIFTSFFGYIISILFGFSWVESLYIGVALTFSSTIIIMKLLSDKRDMYTVYGKISIGFLLVQDLIAMLLLIGISSVQETGTLGVILLITILKGIALVGAVIVIAKYVMPPLTRYIAKSQEFLLLFALGWCLALASLFHFLDFTLETGALLAGMTFALSPFRHDLSAKLKPLRDFFLILFFIILGVQMQFGSASIFPVIVFSMFILIGNPLIVMVIMGLMGYTKRNGFLAGLTVAQISEFSLILIALGVSVGHLSNDILSMVTIVGIITIGASSFMIHHSYSIYSFFAPYLTIFERRGKKIDSFTSRFKKYDIIIFGYRRTSHKIVDTLQMKKKPFALVDFNPETIRITEKMDMHSLYGDANDLDFLDELPKVPLVVSTISRKETNRVILHAFRQKDPKSIVILTAHTVSDALELYREGASYVLIPHLIGGEHLDQIVSSCKNEQNKYAKTRIEHIKQLQKQIEELS